MGKYEKAALKMRRDTLDWFHTCEFAISEIAKESGIHISTFTGKEGNMEWNPSIDTIIKLARARDRLEKRERLANKSQA